MDDAEIAERARALADRGARILRGTFVDSAGVLRARQVPIERAVAFATDGLGTSPAISGFCADDAIELGEHAGPVGDLRLVADLGAAALLTDEVAWAPTDLRDQEGAPWPTCPRRALRHQLSLAAERDLALRTGIEIEFVLFDEATGRPLATQGYGASSLDAHEALVDDATLALGAAGLEVLQLHGEAGSGQFEVSFAARDPLATADGNVLARMVLSAAARRHGALASFSPKAEVDGFGSGAHHHLSLALGGQPLLFGGSGPHGMRPGGEAVIAGLVAALPELVGALSPSAPSALRLGPGAWSGAFACWGLENREAAVRLCAGSRANHFDGHLECKTVDPSANPYVVGALLVGTVLEALEAPSALPTEVTVDPATLDPDALAAAGVVALGGPLSVRLDRLASSALARRILGDVLLEVLVAVRRHEAALLDDLGAAAVVERLRYAWSG